MQQENLEIEVGGVKLIFKTGAFARQANGAVWLQAKDTVILATACARPEASEEVDFFPLRVDYQEKFSAAGKTLSGFIKREGKPTQRETLICRLIDRPIRPLFPEGYFNEVQLITTLYSFDDAVSPDPLAFCATSAALLISDLPFEKAMAAVRVGLIDGNFVINPTPEQQKTSTLDLLLAGTKEAILMIEGYCDFLTEEQILEAISFGHEVIKEICAALSLWQQKVGKPKVFDSVRPVPKDLISSIREKIGDRLHEAILLKGKKERDQSLALLKAEVEKTFLEGEQTLFKKRDVILAFKGQASEAMRHHVLKSNVRPDGRNPEEIRPIHIIQSPLPRTHGSSIFTRGETQALAIATIGGQTMNQRFETPMEAGSERFYLQYAFPPFSVGETGRRELGHGKLAERALTPILPDISEFPYSIRLESQILESNGSSSMASVCGGCLALMAAGIPVKRPIAGIAMGLISEGDDVTILSDISGTEDFLGDMDFKLTGDDQGVTAFQMDIKVEGITLPIMQKALAQAKEGRKHILQKMIEVCPESHKELSRWAPRIEVIRVKPSKISIIIGPGGKQIRSIIEETGVEMDINDEGIVNITGADPEAVQKAKKIVENLVAEVEIGATYMGKIVSIVAFGMFIEILGGKEGLCHISEVANTRIEDLKSLFKEGDPLNVKVLDINDRGQIKLSHKATL